jgi:hypothetical protein
MDYEQDPDPSKNLDAELDPGSMPLHKNIGGNKYENIVIFSSFIVYILGRLHPFEIWKKPEKIRKFV